MATFAEAVAHYDRAITTGRERGDWQRLGTGLAKAAAGYRELGRLTESRRGFERLVDLGQVQELDHYLAAGLAGLGTLAVDLGDYDQARRSLQEALRICAAADLPAVGRVLCQNTEAAAHRQLARVHLVFGRYQEAGSSLLKAIDLWQELGHPDALEAAGNEVLKIGYLEGLVNGILVLEVPTGRGSVRVAAWDAWLAQMGTGRLSRKEYATAVEILLLKKKQGGLWGEVISGPDAPTQTRVNLRLRKNTFPESYLDLSLAEAYVGAERFDEALKLLDSREWQAPPNRFRAHTLRGLALKAKGSLEGASLELLQAFEISERMRLDTRDRIAFLSGGGHGGRLRAYYGLIETLVKRAGRPGVPPRFVTLGQVIVGAGLLLVLGTWLSRRLFGGLPRVLFRALLACAVLLVVAQFFLTFSRRPFLPGKISVYGDDPRQAAFFFAEATKARALLETMARQLRAYRGSDVPRSVRAREQELLYELESIARREERGGGTVGGELSKEDSRRRETLEGELETVIDRLREQAPAYAALRYPQPRTVGELALGADEVLLEYSVCDRVTYLFVVQKTGLTRIIEIPLGSRELASRVRVLTSPLNAIEWRNFSLSRAKELYELLLAEALEGVAPGSELVIVPEGVLTLLPFEALAVEVGSDLEQSSFVGDRWVVRYTQSASVLSLIRALGPSRAERVLFAIGDPLLDRRPESVASGEMSRYPQLPETREEVFRIAEHLGVASESSGVLMGTKANETNLKRAELADYRFLHFATHADLPGEIEGINEPFILLGETWNEGGDDGILTLSETLHLRLDADLVVLAACKTGRGELVAGEGVLNFARAFHHAGARSVVVSLFSVPSSETVNYMGRFYELLALGMERADALAVARREARERHPNPFWWAGFVLYGDG